MLNTAKLFILFAAAFAGKLCAATIQADANLATHGTSRIEWDECAKSAFQAARSALFVWNRS